MMAEQYRYPPIDTDSSQPEIVQTQPTAARENLAAAFDPSAVVMEVCTILSLNIGASFAIILEEENSGGANVVNGDRDECESAIRILILNARDALPGTGEICVRITSEWFDSNTGDFSAGAYVRISVAYIGVHEMRGSRACAQEIPRSPGEIEFSSQREENTIRALATQNDVIISVRNESGEKTVSLWYRQAPDNWSQATSETRN